ncbi:nitrilase-related carbon-nitrogen hydrolase [Aggregatilineales bacterium SYSU G02658]
MRLKLAMAQMYPKLGDVAFNLRAHLDWIEQANQQGAQLIVFPELSLTGYQVQDLVPEVAIRAHPTHPVYRQLLDASHDIDVVVGFVREDERNRFYIASAYLSGGETVHIHHKVYLPTYTMFDDARYFSPGQHIRAFDTRWGRMGMLICEDFWHMSAAYLLWMDGADLMLLMSASPGRGLTEDARLASSRWVELVNQAYGSFFTNYVVHVSRVGYEDGKVFWGGSSIVDPDGTFITHGLYFDEALIVRELDLNMLHRVRSHLPILRDERPDLTLRELERILTTRIMEQP